jgi:hypothetical protein
VRERRTSERKKLSAGERVRAAAPSAPRKRQRQDQHETSRFEGFSQRPLHIIYACVPIFDPAFMPTRLMFEAIVQYRDQQGDETSQPDERPYNGPDGGNAKTSSSSY